MSDSFRRPGRHALAQRIALLSMIAVAGLATGAPPPPPFGFSAPQSHGYSIHVTDAKPREMEMIAASGVSWVRMDLTWGSTEREPGAYDFAAYDRLMASLDRHGIRALFILDYGNRHYDGGLAPATDADRAAFARWVAAAVSHFKGRGILWEMWNEPNLERSWRPQADVTNYIALARAVGLALREAAPDETYIGPGVAGIALPFLEACFRSGLVEDWSAVSVHPYRPSGPESVVADYGRLHDLIARYAPKGKFVPILSGEWGFSSAWDGLVEATQGALPARRCGAASWRLYREQRSAPPRSLCPREPRGPPWFCAPPRRTGQLSRYGSNGTTAG